MQERLLTQKGYVAMIIGLLPQDPSQQNDLPYPRARLVFTNPGGNYRSEDLKNNVLEIIKNAKELGFREITCEDFHHDVTPILVNDLRFVHEYYEEYEVNVEPMLRRASEAGQHRLRQFLTIETFSHRHADAVVALLRKYSLHSGSTKEELAGYINAFSAVALFENSVVGALLLRCEQGKARDVFRVALPGGGTRKSANALLLANCLRKLLAHRIMTVEIICNDAHLVETRNFVLKCQGQQRRLIQFWRLRLDERP